MDIKLFTSIPTWLSLMSLKSGLRIASSSTANRWFEDRPLLVELRIPRYWVAKAPVKFADWEIVKAMPWPPSVGSSETMENANWVENERDRELLNKDVLNRKGNGKKARPICCFEVFVSSKRPFGWIFAISLRSRLAPVKPW